MKFCEGPYIYKWGLNSSLPHVWNDNASFDLICIQPGLNVLWWRSMIKVCLIVVTLVTQKMYSQSVYQSVYKCRIINSPSVGEFYGTVKRSSLQKIYLEERHPERLKVLPSSDRCENISSGSFLSYNSRHHQDVHISVCINSTYW